MKAYPNQVRCVVLFFVITLVGPALSGNAQSAPGGVLLALSKTDHTLALVDPVTLTVMTRIPVGNMPHEVIAAADGKTAYVTQYDGGSTHELNAIDLVARKRLPDIDTRPLYGPHGITVAGGKVWFSAEGSKSVGRYDPATGKLDWSMGTGQNRTHMLYVMPDGKRVYTTNVVSGTVSILEDTLVRATGPATRIDWTQTVVPVGRGAEGFDVSPDGRQLWTVASDDGLISIIDLTTKKRVATIEARALGANRLKFTPDGRLVFIACLRTGDLIVYDVRSRSEVKRLKVGRGAAGIQMSPDGSRAFVASSADNYVAVVDLKTVAITGRVDVGGEPDGLAWAVQPR